MEKQKTIDNSIFITYSEDNPNATKKDLEIKVNKIISEEIKLKPLLEKTRLKVVSELNNIIQDYHNKYNLTLLPNLKNGSIDLIVSVDLRTFNYDSFLQEESLH